VRSFLVAATPLFVGLATDRFALSLYVCLGALMATVSDRGGAYRTRFRQLVVQVPLGACGYLVGALLFGTGPWAILLAAAVAFASGLISGYGAAFSIGAMQLLMFTVIAAAQPAQAPFWVPPLLFVLGGAFAAGLLGIEALVDRRRPERDALRAAVRALADLAAASTEEAFENARRAVTDTGAKAYSVLLDGRKRTEGRTFEAVRGAFALAAFSEAATAMIGRRADGRPLPAVNGWLDSIAAALTSRRGSRRPPRPAELPADDPVVRRIDELADALWWRLPRALTPDARPTDTRPTDTRPTDTRPTEARPTDTRPTGARPPETQLTDTPSADAQAQNAPHPPALDSIGFDYTASTPIASAVRSPVSRARAIPVHSETTRHLRIFGFWTLGRDVVIAAERLALCIAIAVAVEHIVPGGRSYWIALTVALVLKPDFGSVFVRAVQRSIGTAIGVVIGVAILSVVPKGPLLVLVLALCSALLPWAALRSYALQSVFLTPLVLVLFDLLYPGPATVDYGLQRLVDTIIGSAIVLVFGYLIWPRSLTTRLPTAFAHAMSAVGTFLRAACASPRTPGPTALARRTAYRRLSDLRTQLQRSLAEPPPASREAAAWYPAVAAAERICDRITAYSQDRSSTTTSVDPAVVAGLATEITRLARGGGEPANTAAGTGSANTNSASTGPIETAGTDAAGTDAAGTDTAGTDAAGTDAATPTASGASTTNIGSTAAMSAIPGAAAAGAPGTAAGDARSTSADVSTEFAAALDVDLRRLSSLVETARA
jgi:uncharacterized membrane protein YccC